MRSAFALDRERIDRGRAALFPGSSGALVSPYYRGVDTDHPLHLAELGRTVGPRSVPQELHALERIMEQIIAER